MKAKLFLPLLLFASLLWGCHPQPIAPAPAPVLATQPAPPVNPSFPQTDDPRQTVPFLASDAMQGRAPGSRGLVIAGDFLASRLQRIGIAPPPGMKDYFQPFNMPISTSLAPGTSLLLNDRSLPMNVDFSPQSPTRQGPFAGKVIFAGYGITTDQYDDYANLDATGKVALVLRQEPHDARGQSRLAAPNHQWSSNVYFSTKAANAARHGATALLLVTPPSSSDSSEILPFAGDINNSSAALPMLQISRRVADLILSMNRAPDLKSLQEEIDSTGKPHSIDLPDAEISGDITLIHSSASVRNVIGYLPGSGAHADEFIVVGAHYDHLGTGQLGHTLGMPGSIYHGADDNASGSAAVLELAEKFKQSSPLPRSILFVFFTGEEEGLLGSQWFTKNPPVPLSSIVAMFNLDMVGRLKDDNLLVGGWGTAPVFDAMMKSATAGLPIKIQSFERGGLGPSDHMSFALQKIPVLFLFTGLHADYHRPTDTADKINYTGIDEVVTVSQRIITAMAQMPRQPYDGSNDSKATLAQVTGHGPARRAALGVIPDFNSIDSQHGVAISGVGPQSPAELAGLKGGDIITDFNGKPMSNLQDLSDALNDANPGQKILLKVQRSGKPLQLHATLGERSD